MKRKIPLLESAISMSDDEFMQNQAHVKRGLAGDRRVCKDLAEDAHFRRGHQ